MPSRELASAEVKNRSHGYLMNLVLLAVGALLAGLAFNLARNLDGQQNILYRSFLLLAAVGLGAVVLVKMQSSARYFYRTARSASSFDTAAAEAITAIENTLPAAKESLDKEIVSLAASMSGMAAHLQEILKRVDDYSEEVRQLVEQAEEAQALAELRAPAADRIGRALGKHTDDTLREQMAALTQAHREELEKMSRSGNWLAWITLAIGAVIGFITNIVTSLLM
jgi:uncharacterized membrane protein YeaQ/YmgE (transglycosylase-associated protein family)